MPITYFPLNVDVSQVVGTPVRRARLWIETNLPEKTVLAYGDAGQIAVPGGIYDLAGGIGTLTLPTKTGATNVSDWQYVITGEYSLDGVRAEPMDPIYIDAPTSTAAVNLASFIGVTSVPATFMGQAVAQLQAKVDEAEAIKQYVNDVSNIDTTVSAVDFALGQPGPAATLNAAVGEQVADPSSPAGVAVAATVSAGVKPVRDDVAAIRGNPTAPTTASGAVITFIDDDCDPLWYDVWEPICAAQGIKMALCAIGARASGVAPVAEFPSMTTAQLKAIEADGHDILSHGWAHGATSDMTPEWIDADFALAREWMDDNFPKFADVVVYPGGLHPPGGQTIAGAAVLARKNVIRKHFRVGISTTSGPALTPEPFDNWFVGRINGDTATEAQMKTHIDNAVAEGKWLVVMTHAKELDRLGRAANITKLNNVIDYAQSLNVPILPWGEAEKRKGNAVALGEYTATAGKERLFISQRGKATEVPQGSDAKGKWTPTLYGSTTAGTQAYNLTRGFWEINGGLVFLRGFIRINAASTGVVAGAGAASNIVTGGNLVVSISGGANITVALADGDTPAQAATKVATAIGAAGASAVVGGIFRIVSTRTGPAGTVTVVSGGGTILANLGLTAGQTGAGSGFDNTTAGSLRIGGLPPEVALSLRDDASPAFPINFNRFNLATNYAGVWGKLQPGGGAYINLVKQGSGVNEAALLPTEVDGSTAMVLNFTAIYMHADPGWTSLPA